MSKRSNQSRLNRYAAPAGPPPARPGLRRAAAAIGVLGCAMLTPLSAAATTGPAHTQRPTPALVDPDTPRNAKPLARGGAKGLVFSDEFNGGTLDTSKWSIREWARGGAVSPDTWRYEADNVSVDGQGALAISVGNPAPNDYTGGLVDSRGKFDFTRGTLEARVLVPPTNGHLGAVWMLPTDGLAPGGAVDGTARDGAEIDILESNFQADRYTTTVHWDSFYPPEHQQSSVVAGAPGLHSGYHVVGLNWTPRMLEFTYDGEVVRTVTDPRLISQAREYPMLSHEVLDAWADGSIHDEVFDETSSMYVDYIRVWQ